MCLVLLAELLAESFSSTQSFCWGGDRRWWCVAPFWRTILTSVSVFWTSCRQQMKRKMQLETVIVCLFLRVQSGTKLSIISSQTQQKSHGIGPIPRLFQKSWKKSGNFWTHYCLLITKILEFKSLNDLCRHKTWRNSLFCPIPDNDYGEPNQIYGRSGSKSDSYFSSLTTTSCGIFSNTVWNTTGIPEWFLK